MQALFTGDEGDPAKWYWCQALYLNYDFGLHSTEVPHEGTPTARYIMDVKAGAVSPYYPPPLFPAQYWDDYKGYNDGRFYDMSGTFDRDDNTVFFHAVALMCDVNYTNRTLTAYEGVSYGWDFQCVSVPEPAAVWILGMGIVAWGIGRRRQPAH